MSIENIGRCLFSLCNQLSVLFFHPYRQIATHCATAIQSLSTQERHCKRGRLRNISGPILLAISHQRNMFPLVLRSAGQPIPSTVHNPKRVDLVVGCSVLYCTARSVIRALPTVSRPAINNR